MADFKSFLAIGLQAAQDADRRREEIRQVIADLDRQVKEATNGLISIAVEPWDSTGVNQLLKLIEPNKFINSSSIVATAVKKKTKEELAQWEQSKNGYPCQISFGTDVISCEDKGGLENCLGLLLKDPIVGEKIHKLMK
jgi:hypothetical protein